MTTKTTISLGGYRFISNVNPLDEVSEVKQYNFATHDRLYGVEGAQFKGRKARMLTLSIKVVIEKDSDLDIIPNLMILGDSGKPQKMISSIGGSAGFLGDWFIKSVSNTKSKYSGGVAMYQTARLSLMECAE